MSRLVTQLQSYYREEEGTYLIEIKLNQLQQVFNSLDPSPFLDRDLDDNAENYIINSVDEFPLNTPLKLVFYLPSNEQNTARHLLPSALHNYFDYRQQVEQRKLRTIWRQGRISLIIGLSFLFVCLSLSELISRFGSDTFIHFLEEGLLISGWVALWRPLEIFLYEWWPVSHQQKIFAKLAYIPIEIRLLEEPSTPDSFR
ncbi:MAG: hypothetical protein GPI90_05310 [Microcystis aeruginosa K13-05]|jgi:hypothetical protein|uniref:Uncharacterized protein n=1 Tax=Microcystis aeruginosa PCC 9717 TaxID=1160286 RepID=I4FW01_MICAE|nr:MULTISPECIES: hypothetical protein [Microcystis]MCZ8365183.1 hypothetical protein [Microcystis sp. LE19-251.1A]MDJ0530543.1 hypothetical protein [Microcystis sp. M53600_WE12]MDJ0547360.1 hypothetical protein [Microcystis sp. M53601_WE4]NCR79462.1 hypothetical protein [Microcystis aeruginosa K13-10]NCR84106.1 hypothetical protein [Microcystis aeruginosa K13-05]